MNRYKDWLDQAERDLEKAGLDMQQEFYEWACFTSQQAAEKAVKALGMYKNIGIWGHSITAALRSLAESIAIPEEIISLGQKLDAYYIPTRYPNGFDMGKPSDYFNAGMSSEALDAADKIIGFCKDNIA
ncbi:MAG: HEPN domain-containing protein [Actinobacteria bacterium]|nr:MAG: HEPN domain-containing protein [Actinomycetota bacterium]